MNYKKSKKLERYHIRDIKFKFNIAEQYDIKCNGCLNNLLGQDEHMECPSGCLHDKLLCGDC